MGLPQELINYIVNMLQDDPPALKACSLTCKTLFVSTRHLIYRTLHLTPRNNESVLTQKEKKKLCRQKRSRDIQLRFLSHMGEHDLLQYARSVYIHDTEQDSTPNANIFVPDTLLPHLHYFRSLDRVRNLIIEGYDADSWAAHYEACFAHFYPTLTSLTLRRPSGHYQALLRFALQFPNLKYLCFEWLDESVYRILRDVTTPAVIDRSPFARGHLRLARIDDAVDWPMDFVDELRNGFNFQSVELENSFGDHGQRLLNAYADAIEHLTITPSQMGAYWFSSPHRAR